jgi:YbbR domain-containing protein
VSGGWRAVRRALRRDWPGKVGAVLAALVLWWIASSDPGVTVQRSLLVPLTVGGAEVDEVAVGVPARVEVVISGPADRMERLRADDVEAVLDLEGIDGEFAREVEARVPQTLRVLRVVPAEVIGRLEAVRSGRFEVVPHLAPLPDDRVATAVTVDPAAVTVEARDPVLAQVAAVRAPARVGADGEGEAVLVPVDADGRPVAEARVVPERAALRVATEPRLARAALPVRIEAPDDPRLRVEEVAPREVVLVGPAGRIEPLAAVTGEVPDATAALPPGRYDLPVRLALPDEVAAAPPVRVTVRVLADAPDGAEP